MAIAKNAKATTAIRSPVRNGEMFISVPPNVEAIGPRGVPQRSGLQGWAASSFNPLVCIAVLPEADCIEFVVGFAFSDTKVTKGVVNGALGHDGMTNCPAF